MKITRDNCNNVAYSLEPDENSAQQIIDYWTPERKAQAISIMPQIEIEAVSCSFQEMAKIMWPAPMFWNAAAC